MKNTFAKIISYIFHPLLMPSYGILILLNFHSQLYLFIPPRIKIILYLMTFAFTCLLPIINVLVLVRTKFISNVYMELKEERRLSYLTTLVFYISEYYLLSGIQTFSLLKVLILGATLSIALAFTINFYWKISAHMIGIGGLAGVLLALSGEMDVSLLLPFCLFIAGLIGFARLSINAHNPAQVYAGFLLGFFCEWGLFYWIY